MKNKDKYGSDAEMKNAFDLFCRPRESCGGCPVIDKVKEISSATGESWYDIGCTFAFGELDETETV